MTKPDLSDVDAKLDWAVSQIEVLQTKLRAFFQEHARGPWEEPDPQGRGRVVLTTIDQPISKHIQVEAGVIIHVVRSSLDLLMVSLAEHNGSKATNYIHFPIVHEADGLTDKRVRKWLGELCPANADIITALKPYKGGNDHLYALHWLNLKDKHRKLIAVATGHGLEFTGNGHLRSYREYSVPVSPQHSGVVGILDADPGINLKVAFDVALNEIEAIGTRPLIATLNEFARTTQSVVDLFR